MRKKTLTVAAAVMLPALLLTACGGAETPVAEPSPSSTVDYVPPIDSTTPSGGTNENAQTPGGEETVDVTDAEAEALGFDSASAANDAIAEMNAEPLPDPVADAPSDYLIPPKDARRGPIGGEIFGTDLPKKDFDRLRVEAVYHMMTAFNIGQAGTLVTGHYVTQGVMDRMEKMLDSKDLNPVTPFDWGGGLSILPDTGDRVEFRFEGNQLTIQRFPGPYWKDSFIDGADAELTFQFGPADDGMGYNGIEITGMSARWL